MRRALVLTSVLLGTSCTDVPAYYYAPEAANAMRAGMATHIEKIPNEEPQGTLEISTMGITSGQRGEKALHVRMTIDNQGDEKPWTVDVREQLVEIPNVGRSRPQFANAGVQTLPMIEVPRRERQVIDLYYPVPPHVDDADDLAGFDFMWQVATTKRAVAGRTRVDRRELVEPTRSTIHVTSWSPHWWYDPWYPRVVYRTIYVAPRVQQRDR